MKKIFQLLLFRKLHRMLGDILHEPVVCEDCCERGMFRRRPWLAEALSDREDEEFIIQVDKGTICVDTNRILLENKVVHPLDDILNTIEFENTDTGIGHMTKNTWRAAHPECSAMIQKQGPLPENHEMRLVIRMYWNDSKSLFNVVDQSLSTGRGLDNKGCTGNKSAPLALEIGKVNFAID